MSENREREYLIIITKGREDGGKAATLGMEMAVTMQAMNYHVSIFLTLGGTYWAYRESTEGIQVPGHLPLSEYRDAFLAAGGDLMLCAPCVAAYCHLPESSPKELKQQLLPQARYVGLATVAEKLMYCDGFVF